jgi:hypothetical protein
MRKRARFILLPSGDQTCLEDPPAPPMPDSRNRDLGKDEPPIDRGPSAASVDREAMGDARDIREAGNSDAQNHLSSELGIRSIINCSLPTWQGVDFSFALDGGQSSNTIAIPKMESR